MGGNTFYKDLSWLLVLNALIKPVWVFGIDRVVQNRIGYEAYGIYFSHLGLCMSLGFIADVGLTGLMNRELASGNDLNIKSLLTLKALFSAIYIGVIFLIAFVGQIKNVVLLVQVISIQLLTSYLLFFRGIITAQQHFKKDAWLSVLDKSLMIIFGGMLLFTSLNVLLTLSLFLYIQMGALAIAVCAAARTAIRIKDPTVHKPKASLLAQAMPFMLLLLLMSAHNRIDAFLLGQLHPNGAYEAGIYASAYRLLDAGNIVGYLAASFLVPFAARHMGNNKMISDVSVTLRQALLFFSFVVVAFVVVYARPIQGWLYPDLVLYNPNILVLGMAALPAIYITHIYGSLLTAKGALKLFSCIVGISLVINVALNIFLISKGAIGSTIAALISQSFCATACMMACKKEMSVSLKPLGVCMAAMLGALYWALFYFGNKINLSLSLLLSIALVLTALVMFAWWHRIKKTILYP